MRVLLLSLTMILAGCIDLGGLWDEATRPDLRVQRTELVEHGWNQDPRFVVLVDEPEPTGVVITLDGVESHIFDGVSMQGQPFEILMPDGEWTVSYTVADHPWETFNGVRVDSVPPVLAGLERTGIATDGRYRIGEGVTIEPGAQVAVQLDGQTLATSLPYEVQVEDGITSIQVIVTDAAGNQAVAVVQVRSGEAQFLPEGQWDFGVVARYTNRARVWDLSDLDAYLRPTESANAAGGWLGAGHGITPDAPEVQQVVQAVVGPEDTSAEVAWNLYRWMFDALEYDEARLSADDLLSPAETFANDGGVCRDLAAAYVSLLRGAGVPARLISGYLAGDVNGFHAWVEVYVGQLPGSARSPWMPVDVSPMDGRWDDDQQGLPRGEVTAMTSFGIALPEYLALREVPAPETEGWSTALSTHYTYPQGSPEPDVAFEKAIVEETGVQEGRLCFDPDTRIRAIATSCSGHFFPFTISTQRTIDYGVEARNAGPGTHIEAAVALPFHDAAAPDTVTYTVYGQAYRQADGKAVAAFRG